MRGRKKAVTINIALNHLIRVNILCVPIVYRAEGQERRYPGWTHSYRRGGGRRPADGLCIYCSHGAGPADRGVFYQWRTRALKPCGGAATLSYSERGHKAAHRGNDGGIVGGVFSLFSVLIFDTLVP